MPTEKWELNMFDADLSKHVTDYGDIFDLRGKQYHHAMHTLPDERTQECLSLIRETGIRPQMRAADVPTGGGYISRYLEIVDLVGLEVSENFTKQKNENIVLY